MTATAYRVGRKLHRTLYRDDQLIGMMDTEADARLVVDALNRIDGGPDSVSRLAAEVEQLQAAVRVVLDAHYNWIEKQTTDASYKFDDSVLALMTAMKPIDKAGER